MSVSIRMATPDDAEAIVGIYAPYVLNTGITFETEVPTPEEYRQRILETREFFPFYVLEEDGVVAAYAYAHFFRERKAYQWLCEPSIYVRGDRHRKGYASMLYEKLLDALKKQGFCQVIAVVGCPNEPSERFHESMGFVRSAELKNAGYKLGRWFDVKYYILTLRPPEETPQDPVPYDSLCLD